MKKTLITIVATVLVCACVVGGTLAWLYDSSETVTNTFTIGDINISLAETTGDNYDIIPGTTADKNPKLTVEQGSAICWVYVKIVETNNTLDADTKYVNYSLSSDWEVVTTSTDGAAVTTVYALKTVVDASTTKVEKEIFVDNQVSISSDITKDMVSTMTTNKPTIVLTAYAVQQEAGATATAAWNATYGAP